MLGQWWKKAGYSRTVVAETSRGAWRGACERCQWVRGLHTSWCEGVVNGALAPTRARCETLGARYARMATRPVPVPRAQSPESTPAPGGSLLEWDRDRGRDRDMNCLPCIRTVL